jgi:putative transposase
MSRRGDCWDNAVAESFFATIKAELTDHTVYATRATAITSIADYIERFYNPQRRHSHLGYLSPIEFELKAQVAALAA